MDYLKYTIKAAQGTISIGGKVIDAYNMEMLVTQIYDQIYDVYFDIARSHLKAAEESMKASQKSNHPEQEFFAAIHHLYDSFEVLQPLLTKTRTYKSLIFFTTTEDVVKDKIKIYNPCFKICALIFMLYHILEEKNNANDWENKFYFYKEKVQNDNRNKYGGSFWVGKRESCKCIYTCWEYHHMDWDKMCPDCYSQYKCDLEKCTSCTKKCRHYIKGDKILYDDSNEKISDVQYQNLSAISKDFVDRTEEEHRDYRGWGDEVGEIYDEYVTVTYYITAKGKQFRREQELKFKKDVDDFVFHVEQRNYTEAQTVLNRLISYQ